MHKLALTIPQQAGSNPATAGAPPVPSSMPTFPEQPNPRLKAATMAAAELSNLLPPQDVGDPEKVLTAWVKIFAEYPPEVMNEAIVPIARRSDRPSLRLISEVLEDIYAPHRRHVEREIAARQHHRSLPAPRQERTPEQQARIDAQVAAARQVFGPPKPKGWFPPVKAPRDNYAARVAADLEQRRIRRERTA